MFPRVMLLALALTAWSMPSNAQTITSYQLTSCSGCGCKGGPGWRIHKSGRCASHKNLAKACGHPPSNSRCTNELANISGSSLNSFPKQRFLSGPIKNKKTHTASLQGRASVIDADTIEIHGDRIRIFGVDAPEGKQTCKDTLGNDYRCGQIGSIALADYLDRSQPIRCEYQDRDRYGRFVGQCFTAEGHDIANWLARNGHALDYPQYSKGKYASAQNEAKAQRTGIWQGSFVQPWEWRQGVR